MCKTPVRLVPVVHVSAGGSRASQTRACIGARRIPPKRGEPPMPPAPVVVPRIGRSHGKPLSPQCPPPVQWCCGRRSGRRHSDQRIRSPRTKLGGRPGGPHRNARRRQGLAPTHRHERAGPRLGAAHQGRWPRADGPPHLRRPRRRRHRPDQAGRAGTRRRPAAGHLLQGRRDVAGAASGQVQRGRRAGRGEAGLVRQADGRRRSGTSRTGTSPRRSTSPRASRSCPTSSAAASGSARSSTAGCSTGSSRPSRRTPRRALQDLGLVRDRHLRVRHA